MILRTLLLASALLLVAPSLAAQGRPDGVNLPRGADPNDWEAYFDYGVRMMNAGLDENARKALHWSARLDPMRAEPLYGMRVAIFMEDNPRWQRYMADHEPTLKLPRIATADSLLHEAMLRSPFLPRSLDLLLYNQLPGQWRQDPNTRGWLAFAERDMGAAIRHFSRAVERRPNSYRLRMDLAQALVVEGRLDEAAEQVGAVLAALRVRDAREVVRVYESKERLEYALGLLYLSRGRHEEAREALERALLENAGSFAARRGLGLLAAARRDPAGAAEEYARAVEIAGAHPLLDYEYGAALVDARRHAEALPFLARAVEREPFWAAARVELGRAYDGARRRDEALAAYARYLELAPRGQATIIADVRRRMEVLRAAPAAPPPN